MADVLPKLIGWFPAIPSVMTNEIEFYKQRPINIKDGGNLVLISIWFLKKIIVIIIIFKHSWWLTMYREISEHIFAVSKQAE